MQATVEVVACGFQLLSLCHKKVGRDDAAVANDIQLTLVEDTGGNGAKNEFLAVEDDGMTSVGTAGKTCHDVVFGSEDIDDFSFSFVAEYDAQQGVNFSLFHF